MDYLRFIYHFSMIIYLLSVLLGKVFNWLINRFED
jgi:hypothetical protein